MASTISVPTKASLGAFSSEVQTAQSTRGNYDAAMANAIYDIATAAKTDIEALQAGTSIADAAVGTKGVIQLAGDLAGTGGTAAAPRVSGINSATVPAGGALTTGNVLQVSGVSALSYGAVNLAGGSNFVTGVLPVANVATTAGIVHSVRGVVTSNVADLGAFTVATHDGLTFAEGDRVLLAKQTTASQDGIYVVGAVDGGAAPLTRAADWATAMVLPAGSRVVVNEGTAFAHSEWFPSLTGAITVGTSSPAFYPKRVKGVSAAISSGTIAVSNTWILSDTTSVVQLTAKTVGGTQGLLSYGTLTAGAGNGSFTITSTEAGDTSTVGYVIEN